MGMESRVYVISTYDPTDDCDLDNFEFEWRKRRTVVGARAALAAVREFESQGYDRDASIYAERTSNVPIVH